MTINCSSGISTERYMLLEQKQNKYWEQLKQFDVDEWHVLIAGETYDGYPSFVLSGLNSHEEHVVVVVSELDDGSYTCYRRES